MTDGFDLRKKFFPAFFARFILFALAAFLPFACPARAAETITLDECLAIAEVYHPDLTRAAASVSADRGRLIQSVIGDRLKISGSLSTGRSGADGRDDNSSFSAGATASLKLFDSNRSKYSTAAQEQTLAATQETAEQTRRDVRANVKSAYTNLLLYCEAERQRAASVRAFERHLEQAQGFYDSGSKPWYDVTKAQVDLGNARLALTEAQSNIEVGKAELQNAMGVSIEEDFDVAPTSWDIAAETERGAVGLALANRADYRAASYRVEANRATILAEARASSPSISLSSGYTGSGSHAANLDKGWNVGLNMSVPIVDGGETAARVETARAQLASQEAAYEKLRQDITLEIRKVLSDLKKARERIRLSELTLASAEENRRLAEGRYETGVGDALEVTDALVSLTEAQLTKYQAYNDLQSAVIALEKATGTDLTSAPE